LANATATASPQNHYSGTRAFAVKLKRRSPSVAFCLLRSVSQIILQSETAATIGAMPDRLRRPEIIYQDSPIYFVTACTAGRRKLLADKTIHQAFEEFANSSPNYGAWLGSYVLMPDHFHLFVAIDSERMSLSAWLKSLKGTLSSNFRGKGETPPYWQKGFFDHILRSSESYSQKWNYVRENPVRTGLTGSWDEWPYRGEMWDLTFHDAQR
jgi:putative transposase